MVAETPVGLMLRGLIPPLFIGGAGRSGTTLLVDLLGMHPLFSPIYETDFVVSLFNIFYSRDQRISFDQRKHSYADLVENWAMLLPRRPHTKGVHERYVHGPHYIRFSREDMLRETERFLAEVSPHRMDTSVRAYIERLYSLHAEIDGKPHWINKTPQYVGMPLQLLRWFPEMKFIHIIRDGRDAALSAMARPWGPTDLIQGARWWQRSVVSGLRFGELYPNRYVQLRYEDLIRNPVETVAIVLKAVLPEPQPLTVAEGMIHSIPALNQSMIEKWRHHPDQNDVRAFVLLSGPLLEQLGYSLT